MLPTAAFNLLIKLKQDDKKYNESAALCRYRITAHVCHLL
jgi:hypothetical protein